MGADVADNHAVAGAEKKIKRGRGPVEVRLEPSPDILKELGQNKDGQWLVGFAAETEDLIANAQKKLHQKKLHMVVANNAATNRSAFDGDPKLPTHAHRTRPPPLPPALHNA